MRVLLLCLAVLLLAGCGDSADPGAEAPRYAEKPAGVPVYRFAILPLHNPGKSHAAYAPLVRYLEARVPGVRFEFEASMTFDSFERKLRAREVDFALTNPYEALLGMRHGYRVLAKLDRDEDFRGIFLVRRDSPIARPEELRGKVVAYPAPTALAAALQAQHFLQSRGVDVNRDVVNQYVGSHDSALLAVYYRQAAVCATWPPSWRSFRKSHPLEAAELKVVWETPTLPNLPFMVRDDVPPELAGQVRSALLHMHESREGQAILARIEAGAIVPADDETYAPVRRFAREFSARIRTIETYD